MNRKKGSARGMTKRLLTMAMAVCVLTGMMPQNVRAEEAATQTESVVSEEASVEEVTSKETQSEETKTPETPEPDTSVSGNEPTVEPSPEPSPTPAATEQPMVGVFQMPNVVRSGDQTPVSRIQWLKELTEAFEMSVEEDNYPDNYYSDIDSSYADYYTVMLATEFGLVDVEAGDAFELEEPASREFAAHSLNLCMGYINEDAYTFTDQSDTEYADDLQIAVKRGWLELADDKVLPKKALTAEEKDVMITDAKDAVASTEIDPDYQNAYTFAEGVIVLPEGTAAELTGENELTLYSCDTELKAGDIFAVVQENFPVVKKVISVTTEEDKMIVQVESVATEDAFQDIDVEGSLSADLTQIQAFSDQVSLTYIAGGTQEQNWEDGTEYTDAEEVNSEEITAVRAQLSYDIPEAVRKEYNLAKGMKATIDCVITDVVPDYAIKYGRNFAKVYVDEAYFNISATATFTCNVSLDVLDAIGVAPSIELVKVPVGLVGYISASLDLTLKGDITLTLVENISAGIQYHNEEFRLVSDFQKKAFTIQAQVEASAGIKLSAGFDVVVLKGSIYGKIGAKSTIDMQTYDDGKKPASCIQMQAYMYATIGADIDADIIIWKKSWEKSYDIFNEVNSPVKVAFHYEDECAVPECTRDGSEEEDPGSGTVKPHRRWKYYTPASSRYGYSGATSGIDAEGKEYKVFEYSLDDDNNAIITKYQGNMSALNIPDTLDGHSVVEIDENVFSGKNQLRVVVIPNSVTNIGNHAFENCENLTTVILPKGIVSIGWGAFYNCDSLTNIEIPKSLEKTGTYVSGSYEGVFNNCDNLKTVTFEEGTTKIVNDLFANCPGIETIKIPDTVTEIQYRAFYGCENMKEIKIPSSVTNIGEEAFSSDKALTRIDIPTSVTNIGNHAFANCSNLVEIELPKGLTNIGWGAFYDCDALTSMEIPKSLEKTGTYVSASYEGVFNSCDNLKTITFEEGTTKIVNDLFANCPGIETIKIPDTVTEIQYRAFYGCENMKEIKIPSSVTNIGEEAFSSDKALTRIDIPTSVTNIGNHAFANCSNLVEIELPKGLTNIGWGAFYDCDALTSMEIPKSLEKTGTYVSASYEGVFNSCDNLKTITFEEGTTKIVNNLFANCPGIEKITIPDTVTETQYRAFYNCKNLQSVEFSKGLQYIRKEAFKGSGLTEAVLPDSMIELNTYSFAECDKLAEVVLGTGLTKIPSYAFYGCGVLAEIELLPQIQSVEVNAFSDPENMTIYGITGSYAETYAKNVGAKFVNTKTSEPVEEKFTDVEAGAWYVSAVQYAYDNGIMGGKSATTFEPNANLTRAEFATVLYSQSGRPSVTYRPVFKDVEEGAWYTNPVLWAYENGIVGGYANGNFGTSDKITREQLALMMYKYAKAKGYDTTAESVVLEKFSDEAQISTWAREAIQWAASHVIMSGKGNGADGKPLLDPQGNATRAECAAMMKKMLTMN